MPIIVEPDLATARQIVRDLRGHGRIAANAGELERLVAADTDEFLIVFGPGTDPRTALVVAAMRRADRPDVGVLLIREAVDLPTVEEAMRSGVREVVRSGDSEALMAACRRAWAVHAQVRSHGGATARHALPAAAEPSRRGRVVMIFAGKGGCGKSMISTNLAVALAADQRRRVCLVDLDLGLGDVGIMLQLAPSRTIVDAVPMAEHMDETGLRSMLVRHQSGLDAVLAPISPGDAERITAALVTELLTVLRRMFDVVVIDTPPQFSEQVLAALDAADTQILVTAPEVTTLKGLRVTLDMLDLLGYPASARQIVLNRADARAGLSPADIDSVIGQPVTANIPSSPDVPASINRGVPLAYASPAHPVSQAIHHLARSVAGAQNAPATVPRRRGLLRRKAAR